jgi:plasmid stabilization system protein ParE
MRTVVESVEVMADVDEAKERWARTEDAWATVFWVLSRDPTIGEPLTERGHLRAVVFDGSWAHEMPTIYVLYEITETAIVIQKARFTDAKTSAGRA